MKIHSIYESISGEISSIQQGSFVTILRLSHCNLRCTWCDAEDARDGIGREFDIEEISYQIKQFGNKNILITGGEPLLQIDELNELLFELTKKIFIYDILIETNGTINPLKAPFSDNVSFVVDYKMPSSRCFEEMNINNFLSLRWFDYIKFVCHNKDDVDKAIDIKDVLKSKGCRARMAIGQTWEWLQKKDFDLVQYLIEKGEKDFIINFQIHKFLGVE